MSVVEEVGLSISNLNIKVIIIDEISGELLINELILRFIEVKIGVIIFVNKILFSLLVKSEILGIKIILNFVFLVICFLV